MRVVFTWPNMLGEEPQKSVLRRDECAAEIEIIDLDPTGGSCVTVNGAQVWPRLPQEEQAVSASGRAAVPFPIGTRVQLVAAHELGPPTGSFGRVVSLGGSIGVEWEGWSRGHNCRGSAVPNQGYYVNLTDLVAAPLSQTTTTIYPDCETECAGCGAALGACLADGLLYPVSYRHDVLDGRCLDGVSEQDSLFYHEDCVPEAGEGITPLFQVGAEVRITRDVGILNCGLIGTVRTIEPNGYGVEILGIGSRGHNLGGVLLTHQGWNCTADMLELWDGR